MLRCLLDGPSHERGVASRAFNPPSRSQDERLSGVTPCATPKTAAPRAQTGNRTRHRAAAKRARRSGGRAARETRKLRSRAMAALTRWDAFRWDPFKELLLIHLPKAEKPKAKSLEVKVE